MHFVCHKTDKLLSSDFGGFSHHWEGGLDNNIVRNIVSGQNLSV